jgi:DNA-binding transcriptional regulator YhcF (GntR family)
MSLIRIDPDSPLAPYEQLRSQISAMVASGDLEPGQKLPTVRQLAGDLGLAANTVARAYRELEADGVINTQGRRGTFVHSPRLDDGAARPIPDAEQAASVFAATARRMGLSLPEATRLVESAWPRPSG